MNCKNKAKISEENIPVAAFNADIVKSDIVVSEKLPQALAGDANSDEAFYEVGTMGTSCIDHTLSSTDTLSRGKMLATQIRWECAEHYTPVRFLLYLRQDMNL